MKATFLISILMISSLLSTCYNPVFAAGEDAGLNHVSSRLIDDNETAEVDPALVEKMLKESNPGTLSQIGKAFSDGYKAVPSALGQGFGAVPAALGLDKVGTKIKNGPVGKMYRSFQDLRELEKQKRNHGLVFPGVREANLIQAMNKYIGLMVEHIVPDGEIAMSEEDILSDREKSFDNGQVELSSIIQSNRWLAKPGRPDFINKAVTRLLPIRGIKNDIRKAFTLVVSLGPKAPAVEVSGFVEIDRNEAQVNLIGFQNESVSIQNTSFSFEELGVNYIMLGRSCQSAVK